MSRGKQKMIRWHYEIDKKNYPSFLFSIGFLRGPECIYCQVMWKHSSVIDSSVRVCTQTRVTSIEDTMKPPSNTASVESTVQPTDLHTLAEV